MPNLTDDIKKILEQWKGANGGIYATNGCALEIAELITHSPVIAAEVLREGVVRESPFVIGLVQGLASLIKHENETDSTDAG
jgi:hypothetical protein